MDIAAHPQAVFVSAQISLTGKRGGLLGGLGPSQTASGTLPAPEPGMVLWRVIERVSVEKQLQDRRIIPAEDGQSVAYSYTVKGGGGGLFPIDEAGHFEAELVAVYAPPSFLTEVGQVEIISTSVSPEHAQGVAAPVRRTSAPSLAQIEGRLIRLPGEDSVRVWYVENGRKRLLQSPTVGRLRFGDGWQRLIQPLPSAEAALAVPDGPPLTLAEVAEDKLIYSWPQPETYWVQDGLKRRIDDDTDVKARFGDHWRIKLIHLRPTELSEVPTGEPIGVAEILGEDQE